MQPILFNTKMVQAILDGKKTQTRRKIPERIIDQYLAYDEWAQDVAAGCRMDGISCEVSTEKEFYENRMPYHQGDILYVRETWARGYIETSDKEYSNESWWEEWSPSFGSYLNSICHYIYRADDYEEWLGIKWKPSIHMPKEAARIFLRVKDVRVERLNSISDKDCIAEGCGGIPCRACGGNGGRCPDCWGTGWQEPPLLDFMFTWESTIKESEKDLYGWDANPWVFVIEFERINKEETV